MSQKKILLLGGSYAQIPFIKEVKNRGMYIILCDYLPDNPGCEFADEYYCLSTTNFEGVLDLARKTIPDFVFAYASDPAAPTAAYVSEVLGLPGNPFKSVKTLGEKDLFRAFLKNNNFNVPDSRVIKFDAYNEKIIQGLKFPIIIKPTDSSGSKGVIMLKSADKLQEAVHYASSFSRNKRIIAEEYIECSGAQLHGDGFVVDGKLVFLYLGDHHYDIKVNPFVPYSTTWPSSKSLDVLKRVENEVNRAISLSGYKNGSVNIEVRVTFSETIYLMEIGPRSGGNFVPQVVNYATGFDMLNASIDVLTGKSVQNVSAERRNAAYYVIHSRYDGKLKELSISETIQKYIKEFHQYIQTGQRIKKFHGANAAIGLILLLFNDKKEMDYYISNMDQYIYLEIEKSV